MMMRRLTRPLLILLAVVFLFEAWLWSRLAPIVGWIVARIGWRELRARVVAGIAALPPYAAFLVFLVPVLMLLPIKVLGLWLLARGSWLGATATLVLAKLVSMGLTAFIFDITRPKLLELPWFRWFYEHMLTWLEWAHGLIDPIKAQIKRWLWMFSPQRAGRTLRLLRRIRRRMRAQPTG